MYDKRSREDARNSSWAQLRSAFIKVKRDPDTRSEKGPVGLRRKSATETHTRETQVRETEPQEQQGNPSRNRCKAQEKA